MQRQQCSRCDSTAPWHFLGPLCARLVANLGNLIETQPRDIFVFLSERSAVRFRYDSLWETVQRLCKLAGTTAVCTHSLRGLYATRAVESVALSETVESSLGHGSFAMTSRHYAQASSVSTVKIARMDSLLTFGRAPSVEPESLTQLVPKMSTEQRRVEECNCPIATKWLIK